jgi:chemotaxis-related protein WspB
MLFLLFAMGNDRFALDVRHIAEVLPLIRITEVPGAPDAMAGLVNYRGAPVPVIDLSQLALGRPAARILSTRIVMVHYPDGAGAVHLLGLIAERATRTARHEPSDFVASGITSAGTPFLGPVATDAHGLLQWIGVRTLLPVPIRDLLFNQAAQQSWPSPP